MRLRILFAAMVATATAGAACLAGGCSSSSGGATRADAGPDTTSGGHEAGPADAGGGDCGSSGHCGCTGDACPGDGGGLADAGVGLTCGKLLACDQPCSTNACTDGCYAQATGVAQGLFNVFTDCIAAQCPSGDGGPCASPSSSTCSNCNTSAATGACITDLTACEGDSFVGPADPDGGAVVVPNGDAGAELNCGALVACVSACPTDAGADGGACAAACATQATPEALALQASLNACLAIACPDTDGGPCETQGPACSGCIEQVTLAQPNTCAAPYVACNSDTSNTDGGATPTVLLEGGLMTQVVGGLDQAASNLEVSGGYLYFTQVIGNSPVLRLPLVDGGTVAPFGPNHPTPVSVAVDSNNVYVWSVGTFQLSSATNDKDGTVVVVPLDGGAPTTLVSNMEVLYDAAYLNAIAIDSTYVYWVAGAIGSDGAIMRATIGNANAAPIYSNQQIPQALTTDGTNVYWADWGTFNAQGRSNNDGTIWQGPIGGGTPTLLASNQPGPSAIAVDSSSVYWCNLGTLGANNFPAPNTGSVMQVPIGGGSVKTIASSQAVPVSLILAGGSIYWSQYGLSAPGLIMSAPTDGGPVVPLVAGLPDPAALAASPTTLYWTNTNSSPTNGTIFSLSPY